MLGPFFVRILMEEKISDKAKTIGHFIRLARASRNMTLKELSEHTKIHKTLLSNLENDELLNLPSRPYVIGFLRSIASVLEVSFYEALRLFEQTPVEQKETKKKRSVVGTLNILKFPLPLFYKRRELPSMKWVAASLFLLVLIILTIPMVVEKKMAEEVSMKSGRHIANDPAHLETLKNQRNL